MNPLWLATLFYEFNLLRIWKLCFRFLFRNNTSLEFSTNFIGSSFCISWEFNFLNPSRTPQGIKPPFPFIFLLPAAIFFGGVQILYQILVGKFLFCSKLVLLSREPPAWPPKLFFSLSRERIRGLCLPLAHLPIFLSCFSVEPTASLLWSVLWLGLF